MSTELASETEPEILVERRDAVAIVYLNRPQALNAVTPEMAVLYPKVMRQLDADTAIRAIVLTGSGRGFCAGADLSVLGGGAEEIAKVVPGIEDLPNMTKRLSKPVIAAVNGAVAGIGYAYMMGTDVRFIAAEAKIATSFARLGLVAEYGLSWTLPRVVGTGRALDLLISGRAITGEEAVKYGIAEFVVPGADLLDAAVAYAQDLAQNCSPTSMAVIKRQVALDLERGESEAMSETLSLMMTAFEGPDLAEALQAREQKRPVTFPDSTG